MARPRILLHSLAALACGLLTACRSADEYAAAADEEVYRLLAERRAAFVANPRAFGIEPLQGSLRERLLEGEVMSGPISLIEALEVGAENSREFQSRREALYLAALDLTFERFRFSIQENGALAGLLDGSGDDLSSVEVANDLGMTWLLGTGASIVGNIGLSLFRLAGVGDQASLSSDLSLSVTQPLLQGFGPNIVRENLTRAERELVYAVREYERFRRTFAVDVANRYFRILQQHNALQNAEANEQNLQQLSARTEAYAEAGQISAIQADQALQDELRARSNVVDARQRLQGLYDDFKFFLGLPIQTALALDQDEFTTLQQEGLREIPREENLVVDYGLERRLDLHTIRDRVWDAERAVAIAADSIRPGLGLVGRADSLSESGQVFDHDLDRVGWDLDLVLDLPLERLPQRNAYRATRIALEATRRSAVALEDGVVADLRDALRNLKARADNFEIQQSALTLSERRRDSTNMNFEAGRAQTRDVLEAQEDLVAAQDAVTAALVDYYLATLGLYRDMEALRVDAQGIHFERIERNGSMLSGPGSNS